MLPNFRDILQAQIKQYNGSVNRTASYNNAIFNDNKVLKEIEISGNVRNEFIVDHLENDNRNQINLINTLDNELEKIAENNCEDSYRADKEPIKNLENILINNNQRINEENEIIENENEINNLESKEPKISIKNLKKIKLLKKLSKEIINCEVINCIYEYKKKEYEINNLESKKSKISNKELKKIKLLEKINKIKIEINKIKNEDNNKKLNKLNKLPKNKNDEVEEKLNEISQINMINKLPNDANVEIIDENLESKIYLRHLINKFRISNIFKKNSQNSFGNYEKIKFESFDDNYKNSSILNTEKVAHSGALKYNKFEKCNLRLERNDQIFNQNQLLCI